MKISDPDVHVIDISPNGMTCVCQRFVDVDGEHEYALFHRRPPLSLVDKLVRWLSYYKDDRWLFDFLNPKPYRWTRVCRTYNKGLAYRWLAHYEMKNPPGDPPPPPPPKK